MAELIRAAVAMGVTFLDTSDVYGPHTNERLLGGALKGIRDQVQLATKFAIHMDDQGNRSIKGSPEYVRSACLASLERLQTDYVDLYYQHRVDVTVPIEATMGELKKLVEEGKIRHIGLSEASASTIRRAHAVHPITAVQLEWSLWSRDIEDEIVPTCRELGIGIVPYSPLGRGFFSGKAIHEQFQEGDFRKANPRFQGENLEKNKLMYEKVAEFAARKGCTPGQLALAWVLAQGEDVVPIPGTTRLKNLEENLGALQVKFTPEELEEISKAFPKDAVAGERYMAGMNNFTWKHEDTPPMSSWQPQTA
eukprot:SM000063S20000  [mRNA]  locus=s63:194842:197291:+ [translate_table: standard]